MRINQASRADIDGARALRHSQYLRLQRLNRSLFQVDAPMSYHAAVALSLFLGLVVGSPGLAQELKSGPQPGELLPGPFHPYNLNGPFATHPHCLVCEFGPRPVVMVFARDATKITGLLQKLDEVVGRRRDVGLKAFAVILSPDFAKEENRKEVIQSLEKTAADLKNVILAVEGPDGPEKYRINKDADVTVILYRKLNVAANFAYAKDKLTDKEIGDILAAIDKLAAP